MDIQKNKIEEILGTVIYPSTQKSILDENILENFEIDGNAIEINLVFIKSTDPFINSVKRQINTKLKSEYGEDLVVNINANINASSSENKDLEYVGISGVKNFLAVASGKGGVGKSTVTVNLAISLATKGYKVAVIDADIFGPSIPKMFGTEGDVPLNVEYHNQDFIVPIEKYGVKLLSVGHFVNPDEATIWRGPMATNILKQLILKAKWDDIDYMLFDMPPGTSDIHLGLVQTIPVTAALIVSTPQEVAIADAKKAAAMFAVKSINVPIIGFVENMSYFTPEDMPEKKYYIFGKNGVEKLADNLGYNILARLPIVEYICESGDVGKPAALNKDSIIGKAYSEFADSVINAVKIRNEDIPPTEKVKLK